MKRRLLKTILCLTLILSMVMMPMCASAASTAYILKVNKSNVNFRGLNSDGTYYIKHLIGKGTRVLYAGTRNDQMCKVYTSSGEVGYIYKSYLSSYGAIPKNRVGIITKSTKTYKKSGSSLKKNGTLSKGSYVLVYAYNSNWAKCKTMAGKTVYLPRSVIKKAF